MWYNIAFEKSPLDELTALHIDITQDVIANNWENEFPLRNHMYSTLRSYLQGGALSLIYIKTYDYHGKVVEFLHAMIPMYHLKWPHAEKVKKQMKFYNLFWSIDKCIYKYVSKLLSFERFCDWNTVQCEPYALYVSSIVR